MSEYAGKFVDWYDVLYSKKKYADEAKYVIDFFEQKRGRAPDTILDVGCGTGNHARYFAERGVLTVGLEPSVGMCSKAKEKKIQGAHFYNMTVEDYSDLKGSQEIYGVGSVVPFDLSTSLFNVVNHLATVDDLNNFFASISYVSDVLIFDCWNEIAVAADPPRDTFNSVAVNETAQGYRSVVVETFPVYRPIRSEVTLNNSMVVRYVDMVAKTSEIEEKFLYSLKIHLWTPKILKAIAERYFNKVKFGTFCDVDNQLDLHKKYKLMFYCENKL